MAEIREAPISQSQATKLFIEFVMLQAQQVSFFLGRIPNPATGQAVQNLEAARLLIDQLEMLREKTRGNLSSEESQILNHVLSDLQLGYVEVASSPQENTPTPPTELQEEKPSEEGKKKFSKSYGA